MRALVAFVLLLSGCDRVFGLDHPPVDAPDARACFGKSGPNGTGLLEVCPTEIMPGEYQLLQDIDSDDVPPPPCMEIVPQRDLDQTELCVFAADDIRISGAPKLHGKRPIVLVARRTITLDPTAVVDAATHRTGQEGAGSPQAICAQTNNGVSSSTTGGGGGAGGGFNGMGAAGGTAGTSAGGASTPAIPLSGVRAGCRGGRGGNGSSGVAGGIGGEGGGAVYLIAGERIEIGGILDVSGEGGGGGPRSNAGGMGAAGGGGGGTGGLIGLDAPTVIIAADARLAANGGGGGGGGGAFSAGAGTPGMDGGSAVVFGGSYPFRGNGGSAGMPGSGTGGAGASGGAAAVGGANGTATTAGGGGGGGAPGYILVFSEHVEDGGPINYTPPRGP